MEVIKLSLAENIRKFRKKAGLTQIQLSQKLGISISTLRRWEASETAPTGARIFEIAHILNIKPEDLVLVSEWDAKHDIQVLTNNDMFTFEKGDIRIELPQTDKGLKLFQQLVEKFM